MPNSEFTVDNKNQYIENPQEIVPNEKINQPQTSVKQASQSRLIKNPRFYVPFIAVLILVAQGIGLYMIDAKAKDNLQQNKSSVSAKNNSLLSTVFGVVNRIKAQPVNKRVVSERSEISAFYDQIVTDIRRSDISVIYDVGNKQLCREKSDFHNPGITQEEYNKLSGPNKLDVIYSMIGKRDVVTNCQVTREIFIKTNATDMEKTLLKSVQKLSENKYVSIREFPDLIFMQLDKVQPDTKNMFLAVYRLGTMPPKPIPAELNPKTFLKNKDDRILSIQMQYIHESLKQTRTLLEGDSYVLDPSLYQSSDRMLSYDEQFEAIDWQLMRPASVPASMVDLRVHDPVVLEIHLNSVEGRKIPTVKQFEYDEKIKRSFNPPNICNILEQVNNPTSFDKKCIKLHTTKKQYTIYGTEDLHKDYSWGYLAAQVNNTLFTYYFDTYHKPDIIQSEIERFASLLDELVTIDKRELYEK